MGATVLAFDLGGTRLKAGLVDTANGEVRAFTTADVHGATGESALNTVAEIGHAVAGDGQCQAVGLSVPGIVAHGTIISLPGKFDGIVGLDLPAALGQMFDLPPVVMNDAIAYGAGEARFGAGAGGTRVLVVTIGTGVGVTVYEGGLPLGSGPYGGGIIGGHIPFADDSGPVDTNGRRGTIEARCAAAAIVYEARAAGLAADDVQVVYAARAAGDKRAITAIDAYRSWLTRALVVLAHAHAPDVIVLGGGPIHEDDPVVGGLADAVNDRLWPGYEVAVRRATLGDHAPLVGLAHLCAQVAGS